MAFLFFLSSGKEIIMRMDKIAKGLGLCTIGFTGGMIFTGYQLGKLVKSDRVKKAIRKEISDWIYKKLFFKHRDAENEEINIIFDTLEEAEKISDQLTDIAERYGIVTMADVYQACGGFDVEDYDLLNDIGWLTENLVICVKKLRFYRYNHKHPWDAYCMTLTKKPERMV